MSNESDSGTMLDLMPGNNEHDIKNILNNKDLQVELKRILDTLTWRERSAVVSYFGLFGEPQKSLEEIGMDFDLTRERVRQIKEKALRKLKTRVRRTTLKEYR